MPAGPVTYEEFLDWCDEDVHAEWVDGWIEVSTPASLRHQQVLGWLYRVLSEAAESTRAGEVVTAPFQMRLREPLQRGREPDLLFVATDHRDRWRPTFLDGPADLVVEVLSPESLVRDRGVKYSEYEAAGIPEYWLIDPDRETFEVYRLDERGHYQPVFNGRTGIYETPRLPGLRLDAAWLWQEPLPSLSRLRPDLGLPR